MGKANRGLECLICGDRIFSDHRHDFKECSCGSCSVDGGSDYFKFSAKDLNYVAEIDRNYKIKVGDKFEVVSVSDFWKSEFFEGQILTIARTTETESLTEDQWTITPEGKFQGHENEVILKRLEPCPPKEDHQPEQSEGVKHDTRKLQWWLFAPLWGALEEIVRVLMFGAKKYSAHNWQKIDPQRYKDAAMRHLVAYVSGDKIDPESGKSHLAHLGCCMFFLMWFDGNKTPTGGGIEDATNI